MSVHYAPEKLTQVALHRGVSLDSRVDRDNTFRPLHGGMAVVYRGTLHPQETAIAIKCLRFYPHGDESNIDHIVREIHTWTELQHENLVPVFGVVTKFDFAVSIVSEWMEKGNAFDHVQDEAVDPRPLLLGVAHGLQYLHDRGILHGDLRSRNVLVSKDGPPEQIDGYGKVTTQADVWAFGITALELFTRKPPHHDIPDTRKVILRILNGPPTRPTDQSTCSRLTDDWWELCSLCWKDESSRPPISNIVSRIESAMNPAPRSDFFWFVSYVVRLVRRFGQ
ncbi:kinase-like domain-containing protein [Pisolithus microcarpus]|nr:kinase-like domain-containing protein [Pisolithus microcarpus]